MAGAGARASSPYHIPGSGRSPSILPGRRGITARAASGRSCRGWWSDVISSGERRREKPLKTVSAALGRRNTPLKRGVNESRASPGRILSRTPCFRRPADLEVGDTAGLEACATTEGRVINPTRFAGFQTGQPSCFRAQEENLRMPAFAGNCRQGYVTTVYTRARRSH